MRHLGGRGLSRSRRGLRRCSLGRRCRLGCWRRRGLGCWRRRRAVQLHVTSRVHAHHVVVCPLLGHVRHDLVVLLRVFMPDVLLLESDVLQVRLPEPLDDLVVVQRGEHDVAEQLLEPRRDHQIWVGEDEQRCGHEALDELVEVQLAQHCALAVALHRAEHALHDRRPEARARDVRVLAEGDKLVYVDRLLASLAGHLGSFRAAVGLAVVVEDLA
mmetsp:Transcript_16635/g.56736  ORF Transcript_16635/g.56736 Transcript_16635/m.56736 type:complete len:215 (-) Transcript_16635:1461-2105(-)